MYENGSGINKLRGLMCHKTKPAYRKCYLQNIRLEILSLYIYIYITEYGIRKPLKVDMP